jgi:hypothetical protein
MKYSYDEDKLTITLEPEDKIELEDIDNLSLDSNMCLFFDSLLGNSELEWVNPEDTGDLTDAPMLGITTEDANSQPVYGKVYVGSWDKEDHYANIIYRWAFMDYQIISVLERLKKEGQVTFVSK